MRFWLFVSVIMLAAISFAQVPESNHVVLLTEENHGYSSVIGSTSMPYLNSLASKYGLATQYYANTHPSIGNYFEMTTGRLLTNDDTLTPARFPVSADNLVRQLMVAGKTWKSYAEGLPYAGYTGGNTGNYVVQRNPFAYFTEVQNSNTEKMNLVPFSQFATDLANNQLPNFSYLVPDVSHDGRSGTLQQADSWLKQNIAPLLANADFQQDGLLIITFNEAASTDTAHGGGRVATLVIGPKARLGYKSATLYQHQNLLRTVLTALGSTNFPGEAASVQAMSDLFASSNTQQATAQSAVTASAGVTISSPASGATVSSPVRFVASAMSGNSANPITAMRIYVDNASMYTVNAANVDTSLALASGAHNVTVVAWDSTGKSYTKSASITVGTATTAPTTGGVTVSSPANGATVSSPVQFVASAKANSGKTITTMKIYVDNVDSYTVNATSLNTSLNLANGAHYVVIQAWDDSGAVYKSERNITVGSASSGSSGGAQTPPSGTYSIWNASTMPGTVDSGDASAVQLGVKFKTDSNGYISGIRYYKSAGNTGTHVGTLWSSTGTKLATATFTNETASGWQQVNFANPVAVTAGTVYVASYFAPAGHYSDTANDLTSKGVDNAPLHAMQNGGVYAYGSANNFPNQVWNGCNYWVDVVFTTSANNNTTGGTLAATPNSLSFGNVATGSSSTQNVTLTASSASITVSQANVTGAGFSISGLTLPMTLAAGQSATFQVKFAPAASGNATGSVSLVSNASTPMSIALSGTGGTTTAPPTAHSATLNWAASTSSGVSGYNVYRGTQSGGPYTKLTKITGTTYTDNSVSAGATYYYVVTAVNTSGTESGYSSSAKATVPTP